MKPEEIFFEIHSGLPREGPGDFESTKLAFESIPKLPEQTKILDVGCGPGKQTVDLAKISNAQITAVDNHQPFLEALKDKMEEENLEDKITPVLGDMFNLNFTEKSFDAIWSEGAIYIMGFEDGLNKWKRFLKDDGYIAVTEASWLKSNPPEELRKFWQEGYPDMKTVEGNLEIIEKSGFRVIDYFVLPESAWWDEYYYYVQKRVDTLKKKYKDNPKVLSVLTMEETEMELYRKYSDFYGYVFFIMQRN
jgi:ubiquinone/menaquinone biosynthesis C-methylase UbiE